MPYHVGGKGTNGCAGFPVVDDKGKVMGCHPTQAHANRQVQALYAAGAAEKAMTIFERALSKADVISQPAPENNAGETTYQGCGCPTCEELNCDCPECPNCGEDMNMPIEEGMMKREFSGKTRERMASEGTAMPDGSFPISNRNDLMNAIRSVGRAKNYAAAKEHIVRRARALGLIDMLPEDWKKGVRKTMWGGTVFDLNPFVK